MKNQADNIIKAISLSLILLIASTQTSIGQSKDLGKQRILGTMVGAFVGISSFYIFSNLLPYTFLSIAISLTVLVTIYSCVKLGIPLGIPTACIIVISIFSITSSDYISIATLRVFETMYGVLVGIASQDIPKGGLIHTFNLHHAATDFKGKQEEYHWTAPDISKFQNRTFNGYHRADGQVGTQNYWLVIPLVFCENRNIELLKNAFINGLGFQKNDPFTEQVVILKNQIQLHIAI